MLSVTRYISYRQHVALNLGTKKPKRGRPPEERQTNSLGTPGKILRTAAPVLGLQPSPKAGTVTNRLLEYQSLNGSILSSPQ